MIKLIATDMDGTLLDDKKNLPENFDEILSGLSDKKIRFVISSGRSFCTLKKQFQKYLDDLIFICDNGAFVYDRNEEVKVSILPRKLVLDVIGFCEDLGLTVLLCGRNGTWHNAINQAQNDEIASYYVNQVRLDDLSDFDDDIFKIAIFRESGIESEDYPKLVRRYGADFNVQLSGKYWTDIMNKDVTKGEALRIIQNRLGIEYEETMAFGDYLNDIEMLNNAYYSFAMQNSHDQVKKIANFSTGTNNDNSVMKEIEKYAL